MKQNIHTYQIHKQSLKCWRYTLMYLLIILITPLVTQSQTTVIIGANSGANAQNDSYPCPIGDYYTSHRAQYLYRQAELSAAGIVTGNNITSLGWVVNATNISGHLLPGYTISVKNASLASLTITTWESGMTVKYGPANYSYPSGFAGNVVFPMSGGGFIYTGGDLIVEVCHTFLVAGDFTDNPRVQWTTGLGPVVHHSYRDDNVQGCGTSQTTQQTPNGRRPRLVVTYSLPAVCSGAPTPGPTLSSVANACPGVPFNLSFTNGITTSGITFQWQQNTGTGFSNISGATNSTYTATQTVATAYRCRVTCTATGGSTTNSNAITVGMNSFLNCYCSESYANSVEPITLVQFSNINNSSCQPVGCGPALENFTGLPAGNVAAQNTYPITVKGNTAGGFTTYIRVFIDFNQNGLLTDAGESFDIGTIASSTGLDAVQLTGNILIPISALPGTTLMRVTKLFAGYQDPCNTAGFGQSEDYLLNITNNICFGTPLPGTISGPASVCSGADFTLTASGISTDAGIQYQWQSAATCAGTWTNIAGETNSFLATTQTVATSYRLESKCINGGATNTSNCITLAMSAVTNCFCIPVYTNTGGSQPATGNGCSDNDLISNFVINGNSFPSSCSPGAYSYTPSPVINLIEGNTYPFTITLGNPGFTTFEEAVKVWVDRNDNGVFANGEIISESAGLVQNSYTGSFTIPACTNPGQHRLRIRINFNSTAFNACNTREFGETEDYLINIIAAPVVPAIARPVSGPSSVACNSTASFSVAAGFTGIITWQYSTSPSGPFTDVVNSNFQNILIDFSLLGPGTYYTRAKFTGQGCTADVFSPNSITTVVGSATVSLTTSPGLNLCRGQSATISASGVGPFTWNTGQTSTSISPSPIYTTTYSVTSGSGVCTGTAAVTLNVSGPLAAATVADVAPECPGSARNLLANEQTSGSAGITTFSGLGVTVPLTSNPANPYPSNLTASGLSIASTIASVTLHGLQHTFPNDLQIALVAPNGSKVLLVSDNGNGVNINGDLTFVDGGAVMTTGFSGPLPPGTYAPTSSTLWSGPTITGPFGNTLASFTGSMNGVWKLYIYDTSILDGGSMASWTINFTSVGPPFNYNGPVTYSWSNGLNQFATTPNTNVTPNTTTTYYLTVADNICSQTSSVLVNVLPQPSATFTTDLSNFYCESQTINFNSTIVGSQGPGTPPTPGTITLNVQGITFIDEISWSIKNSSSVVLLSGSWPTPTLGGSYSYPVTPAISDYPLTFSYETVGGFNDNQANYQLICSTGNTTILSGTMLGTSYPGGVGTYTSPGISSCLNPYVAASSIVWSNNGTTSFTSNVEDPSLFGAQVGHSGDYTITFTDVNGCVASNTQYIEVNPNPVANVTTAPVSCIGMNDGTATFNITVQPTYNDYAILEGSNTGSNNPQTFTGYFDGTYFYQVSELNTGCTSFGSFLIETVPNVAPAITVAANNLSVECDGAGNTSELNAWLTSNGGADAFDACGVLSWSNNYSALTSSCGNTGSVIVTFTATDEQFATATTTATFTIVDTTDPDIDTQASNSSVECDGAGNTAALNAWIANNGGATASDICSNVTWSNNFVSLSDLCGSTGSATVIFTATDDCNNTSTTSATFTIVDTTDPVIDTPASAETVECDGSGNSGALNAWLTNHGGATASDICSNVTWSHNYTALSDDCGATGNATVIFTATDDCGNTSATSATFTIVDTTAPVISCPANITLNNTANQCGANVSYAATASDVCSGTASLSYSIAPGSFFAIGTTTVNTTATDACGNTSSCSFTVTVNDNQQPLISCPGNMNASNSPGLCGANVTYSAPVGSDNCLFSVTQTNGMPSGGLFPIGTTTNTFVITDASGNTNTCSFSVTVVDNEAPSYVGTSTCPASFTACNPVSWTAPLFQDNCPGLQVTSTATPGSNFQIGVTPVTYTATDLKGNPTTCTFYVTVLDSSLEATSITSNRDFNNICNGGDVTLTVNGGHLGESAPGVPAQWKWYSGGCGNSGGGVLVGTGTTVTVAPTTTTTFYVRAEGGCRTTACVQLTIVVTNGPPIGTPVYTTIPAQGAPGVTGVISVAPVTGATFYQWFTNGGHINSVLFNGNLSPEYTAGPSVNISFVLPQQNYQIRVLAGNACGRTGQSNTHIRGTVSAPTSMTGPTQACPGSPVTYTIPVIPPVSGNSPVTYQWTLVPTTAGTITMSANGLSATVNFAVGFGSAQVCANGVSSFGLPGAQYCTSVTSSAPVPGAISGNPAPCSGNVIPEIYSITAVPSAISYSWTCSVPGATVVQAGNGLSASITFPATTFTGTVQVTASSSCGTSAPSVLNITNGVPGNPGNISGATGGLCGAQDVAFSVTTSNALSYLWTVSTGMSIDGFNNLNAVTIDFLPGFSSGTVSVEAFYACGSVVKTHPVSGTPSAPALAPAALCANSFGTFFVTNLEPSTDYTWTTSGDITDEYCSFGSASNCSGYYIETGPAGGSFTVTATNTCGTASTTSDPCRVMAESIDMKIYPNPTNGLVTVELYSKMGGTFKVSITDLSGRQVFSQEFKASSGRNQQEIDLGFANAGLYMVYIKDSLGNIGVQKLSVE